MAKHKGGRQNVAAFCRPGETVPQTGVYDVVDPQGQAMDYEPIQLEQGERFPQLKNLNLCYRFLSKTEPVLPEKNTVPPILPL